MCVCLVAHSASGCLWFRVSCVRESPPSGPISEPISLRIYPSFGHRGLYRFCFLCSKFWNQFNWIKIGFKLNKVQTSMKSTMKHLSNGRLLCDDTVCFDLKSWTTWSSARVKFFNNLTKRKLRKPMVVCKLKFTDDELKLFCHFNMSSNFCQTGAF